MNRFVACLCVLPVPVYASVCLGQDQGPTRDDATIEKVVAESAEAGPKLDWKRYADLIHPESLQEYKDMWLPVLRVATRERPEQQADLLSAFANVKDLKTLMDLDPKAFFVSSMMGMVSQLHGLNASPPKADQKIIGTVREGDDQAHVVVRTRGKLAGAQIDRVDLVSLKRSGKEWKLMLPAQVRAMAEMFKRTGYGVQKSGPVTDRADPDKPK